MWQNEDLAIISAQQYYVDYGLDLTIERLSSLLPSYLPDSYLESQKEASYWIQVQQIVIVKKVNVPKPMRSVGWVLMSLAWAVSP